MKLYHSAVTRTERLEWIDAIRGIAVVLVVVYHSIIALTFADPVTTVWLDRLNDALSPLRMPILMLLSGLLLSRSLSKAPGAYVSGKLRAIGWPYLVWTAITLSFLYLGSRTAGNGNFTVGRVLESVVDPRTYTWYLAYLLVFYLLALLIPAKYRLVLIPVLLVACGVAADDEGWSRFTYLLAFFFFGDVVMRHRERWGVIQRPVVIAVAAAASLTTIALSGYDVPMRYTVWSVPGTLGTVICLMAASGWLIRRVPISVTVGRDSIVYYVTHWPVVTATAHLLARTGVTNGSVATLIMVASGLGVSAGMVWLRHRSRLVAGLYAFPRRQTARLFDPS